MAMSLLPNSRPRLGAETLEQCPYDSYHWVRPAKLDEHVAKCRKNYDDQLFKDKGYHQLSLSCLHNCQHKVFQAEWKFHMAPCPDRKKLWTYKLQAGPLKDKFPDSLSITGEDLPKRKGELFELYDGLKSGHLFSDYQQYVKLSHIGKRSGEIAQDDAEARGRLMAEEAKEAWILGKEEPKVKKEPPAFQVNYTKEEIEYWNPPGVKGRPFSWMAHNSRPRGYVTNYPPGLNKRERREFDLRNSELYEKKLAKEAKAREAAQAAKEQEEGDQGIETETTGAEEKKAGEGGDFPEEEEEDEDDDGWVSQFTPGPARMNWGN